MGSRDSGERRTVAAAAVTAGLVIAQQVAGKATRDALFLSHHSAMDLSVVMAASAVLSLGVVLALGRIQSRWSPPRAVPAVFVASAGLFVAEWWLAARHPPVVAVIVYLHTAALGAALVSGFWSCINERFDPHTARRIIGRIAGGAALGGIAGGALAWQAGTLLSLSWMLAILAALSVVCAVGVFAIGGPGGEGETRADPAASGSGLRTLRRMPYLRHLALMVALIAVADTAIDFVFKARASASIHGGPSLISFFALFYTVTGVATFAIQSVLARRALARVGLTGTVAALPGTLAIGSALALAAPGLWTIGALRGAGNAVASSLYRSGYELLYTPLAPADKRSSKTLIDVGCDRLGGALGSGLAMLAIAIVPSAASPILLAVSISSAAACLLLCGLLHSGYVAALADGLRRGAVALDSADVMDSLTRNTLHDTTMAIDRERLLQELAGLRDKADDVGPLSQGEVEPVPLSTADSADEPLLRVIAELRSRDAARLQAVLETGPLAPELTSFLIPLLARNDVRARVEARLGELASARAGQLVDALLDRQTEFAVRRRIPRLLSTCPSQRAADGLLAGLADERFEVRYRCATALHLLARDHPDVSVAPEAVLAAARREASVGAHVWRSHRLLDGTSEDDPLSSPVASARDLGRGLEHVFNLLSLALDREPLQLAFRALAADDERLRGTGLEYLENVLPADIRDALRPYLGDRRLAAGAPRQREQIVSDLMVSLGRLPLPPVSTGDAER